MNKKIWFVTGILIAVALGIFLPELVMKNVQGSSHEVTYQFTHLGLTTAESRKEMESILEDIIGISKADIDPSSDRITLTFNEDTMKAEWIAKSLDAHGYPPEDYKQIK